MNTPTPKDVYKQMVSLEEALRIFTDCVPADLEAKITKKSVATVFRDRAARKKAREESNGEKLILSNKPKRRTA